MTRIIGRKEEIRRDDQTYAIIGAAMEVHQALGPGFLEPVYQEALALELAANKIPYVREVRLPIYYKGTPLSLRYRADFICFSDVLVELKALDQLTNREEAQIIHYLIASRSGRGILLNFGALSLHFKRFVGPASLCLSQSVKSVKSVDAEIRIP